MRLHYSSSLLRAWSLSGGAHLASVIRGFVPIKSGPKALHCMYHRTEDFKQPEFKQPAVPWMQVCTLRCSLGICVPQVAMNAFW